MMGRACRITLPFETSGLTITPGNLFSSQLTAGGAFLYCFTIIYTSGPNNSDYTEPVPLHYVHHTSPRTDAIPMLFIHGWPGSFLEVGPIINLLTNPPNASLPAFHVVAPSIPGFGFSPAPTRSGFGPKEAGHAFNSLMMQLNYTKYVINGGDLGAFVLRHQAASYPSNVVSTICNFWLIQPNATDLSRFASNQTTEDESYYIQGVQAYQNERSGYRYVHQTEPLSISYAMTDSPIGYAMWIYSLMNGATDRRVRNWSPEEVITWTLMYLIQGPYGSLRFYKEAVSDGDWVGFGFGDFPFVEQPTAISLFPYDLWYRLPLDWAQRRGNVTARYLHDRGDHFPAYGTPELFASDIWAFFLEMNHSLGSRLFGLFNVRIPLTLNI
ncbi:Epoxide hydrolase-like protein [Macrophomina phaseolina MS6]|uniref:Epoxide hydrolase-like protein n=1 Tax=Macrophomina phaseolina (strain MS6) TaxID=1126212 RepID=K2RZ72_MACPH|nr:Epoxide hydrolase-like protein [Macrophomina phaseolina MS6]